MYKPNYRITARQHGRTFFLTPKFMATDVHTRALNLSSHAQAQRVASYENMSQDYWAWKWRVEAFPILVENFDG